MLVQGKKRSVHKIRTFARSMDILQRVRFKVLTAVTVKITFFCDVTPCNLVHIKAYS